MKVNGTMDTTPPAVESKTIPPRARRIFKDLKRLCKEKMKKDPHIITDTPYCRREADNWGGCWPDTAAGHTANISCPDLPIFNTNYFALRACSANGTWVLYFALRACSANGTWVLGDQRTSANYTLCRINKTVTDEDLSYIYIFIGGFSLSVITLLVSLTIFSSFRQLRCDRITIHKNLFLSYVFTGISWLGYYVFVALEGDVLVNNPVWCRVLHVVCQYFTVCNFFWMFCEGLYLNTIMVYAFNSGKVLLMTCHVIGWGLPVVLTAIYAGIRSSSELETLDCWFAESQLQWILYGPVVFSIIVNALFLINIVRLLVIKLKQQPGVSQTNDEDIRTPIEAMSKLSILVFAKNRNLSTWKATRATLILVPLLGIQYLLFPIRPPDGSPLDGIYHISVALLVSLQGTFVSIIYCFCNGEVLTVLGRKYTQRRLMNRRSSLKSNSGPPGGTYTTVDHGIAQNTFCLVYKEPTKDKERQQQTCDTT